MSLLQLSYFDEIYLYRPVVDFRKDILGLADIVQNEMRLSPFKKSLYLFCSRDKSKLKALYWDKSGFALWYKILEKEKFQWPKHLTKENIIVDIEKLELFSEGLNPWKIPHKKLSYEII